MIYECEKLKLVPFTHDSTEGNYRNWFNDPDITKWTSHGSYPLTRQEIMNFSEEALHNESTIVWNIFTKGDILVPDSIGGGNLTTHIGNVSLQQIDHLNQNAELAIIIGEKEYWGRDYGTDACLFALYHGFIKLNLQSIYMGTPDENTGMRKIAGRLGFKYEGTHRRRMFLNGKLRNICLYSILREEFDNSWGEYFKLDKISNTSF